MITTILSAGRLATAMLQLRSTIRIGITGFARASKTALLTSLAARHPQSWVLTLFAS
jgi:predicted YcjX-like family ATPase